MRLLKRDQDGELSLTKDLRAEDFPQYAILSHTWAPDSEEEVTFRDFSDGTGRSKLGYKKIRFCADQARRDGLQHFWNATRCYVYLSDVSAKDCPQSGAPDCAPWEPAFRASRWFTRGWTLQELLAPAPEAVLFFDRDGMLLGDKTFLSRQIYEITQVPVPALFGTPLAEFGTEDRFAWAKERNTTREEDWAYSLQGIFGVYLLHKYGEGKTNAVRRLRREIKDAVCGADGQDIVTGKWP
ncbi:hypothetical protein GQ53DRAFT_775900 [Thozetella sp. PMI_491]|nr:hypothetical protein GQ53DRAFT_775900 [Thozetella sp. PMI_491]